MQSLFPQHNSQPAGEKPLLEFKAGKCEMTISSGEEKEGEQEENNSSEEKEEKGQEFLVTPLLKRGKIAIVKGEGYVYFRWIDRTTNEIDTNCNWIVFPHGVVFKKINTGREGDRVYLLEWKDENRRMMFWMQDKSKDKDEENCKQVNELFNNPQAVAAAASANQESNVPTGSNNGAEEWMRMLGISPPSNSGATNSSRSATNATQGNQNPSNNGNNAQALDLARILAGLGANSNNTAPQATSSSMGSSSSSSSTNSTGRASGSALSAGDLQRAFASTTAGSQNQNVARSTDLNRVLSAESVIETGVLNDPTVRQNLLQLLPEGQQSDAYLETNLRSPQFQQALDALSNALNSESFNSVMANLGIDPSPGSNHLIRGDFIGAFLAAANAAASQRQSNTSNSQGNEAEENESKMDESP